MSKVDLSRYTFKDLIYLSDLHHILNNVNFSIHLKLYSPNIINPTFYVNTVRDNVNDGYSTGSSDDVPPFNFNLGEKNLYKIGEILYNTRDNNQISYLVEIYDYKDKLSYYYYPIYYIGDIESDGSINYSIELKSFGIKKYNMMWRGVKQWITIMKKYPTKQYAVIIVEWKTTIKLGIIIASIFVMMTAS